MLARASLIPPPCCCCCCRPHAEMRTLCDACEAAPARFFCAADEAALCPKCDQEVHGCNKLAGRHVRLELAEARKVPPCDICEINPAYIFCSVDGTSLCVHCDMNVHVGGKRTHERFILMGQRVELPMFLLEEGVPVQDKPVMVGNYASHGAPKLHVQVNCSDECNSSDAPAVAIAVEAELTNSQPTDLSSGPTNTQGIHYESPQEQNDEQISSSDDGCARAVPELADS